MQEAESRLGQATRRGDSERRLGEATRRGDSEWGRADRPGRFYGIRRPRRSLAAGPRWPPSRDGRAGAGDGDPRHASAGGGCVSLYIWVSLYICASLYVCGSRLLAGGAWVKSGMRSGRGRLGAA